MRDQERLQARRRSPGWVRKMEGRDLHALAGRLDRESRTTDLSTGQEWLFDAVLSELEYRHRRACRMDGMRPCCCAWCCGPFCPHRNTELQPELP